MFKGGRFSSGYASPDPSGPAAGGLGVDRSVSALGAQQVAVARQRIDIELGLLDRIDEGWEIIFFADEAGAWQVGVHWEKSCRRGSESSRRRRRLTSLASGS